MQLKKVYLLNALRPLSTCHRVVLPQPPNQPVTATLNGSAASWRMVVACRGNTTSFDTFADANSEAHIAGTEHLFVKRERWREER
jgi:hypothetical protein